MRLFAIALSLVLSAQIAHAAPTDLCESAIEGAAAKFLQCRLNAESKYSRTLDAATRLDALTKCGDKFAKAVQMAKSRNGEGNCTPVSGDDFKAYMGGCSDGVEGAAKLTGALPTCSADLQTCSADLTECNGLFSTCTGSLGTCETAKGTCQTSLTTVQSDLSTCTTAKTACEGSLSTCQTTLTSTQGSLSTCSGTLSTCQTDKTACDGSLATAQAGTATAGQVLAGRTFASASGLSSTGTMVNRGAVTIAPGSADQSIAAGYHNGSGRVEGDPDLVASNIVSGVSMFGVSGTATVGPVVTNGLLKTGQTTSYGAGSDGTAQAGTAQSFTDNGDGTVTDNRTSLMWEKKSADGSIHDVNQTYTWGQSGDPYSMNGTMVTTYLTTLNSPPCFAAACDWRIPNRNELLSIANLGTANIATFSAFNEGCAVGCSATICSCTRSDYYWSASTYWDSPGYAWSVGFYSGNVLADIKTDSHYVRAVRGGS